MLKWFQDERGQAASYIALAFSLFVLLGAGVGYMADMQHTAQVRSNLVQAGHMILSYEAQDGCLTNQDVRIVQNFLQNNGIDPAGVYLDANTARQSYGQGGNYVDIGYDYTIANLPLVGTWKGYVGPVQVTAAKSSYVPSASADTSSCDSNVLAVFSGSSTFGGGGGGGGPTPVTITSVSVQLSANGSQAATSLTVPAGTTVDVGGAESPAVPGTLVAVATPVGTQYVTANSAGTYGMAFVVDTPGAYTVTATAASQTASASLTVTPGAAADITLSYPAQVQVGQSFNISGAATDAYGNPVPNGTAIMVSTADGSMFTSPSPFPSSVTASGGAFAIQGIVPDALGTATISFSSASATATASITVQPGPAQKVTIQASAATVTAGGTVSFSGQVTGPYNTPVAQGTKLDVTSTDTTDNIMPDGTPTTDANGDWADPPSGGTTPIILTVAGSQTVTATVDQTGSQAQPASVQVQVLPASPAQVADLTATPGQTEVGSNVQIAGVLEDKYGNPEPGVSVSVQSGEMAAPVSVTTNTSGQFSATVQFTQAGQDTAQIVWNGNVLGQISVDVLPMASYTLTLTPAQTTIEAGTADTVTVTLTDANGNPVGGQTVGISESPQGSGVLSATSVTTGANGTATFTVTPTQEGTATVTGTADIGGATVQNSASITVNHGSPNQIT